MFPQVKEYNLSRLAPRSLFVSATMNRIFTGLVLLLATTACVEESEPPDTDSTSSEIATPRRDRATLIRTISGDFGLGQGALLIAGVANAETGLAHCWDEAQWACQGPPSADCGWGPVISGAGDGPCWAREGGLGMFQFDGGNHDQTLARDGAGILTLRGNIEHGVAFILNIVMASEHIPGVATPDEALAFLNRAWPGTTAYDQFLTTIVHRYNGCRPGACGVFWSRYDHYDGKTRALIREFGAEFWRGSAGERTRPDGGARFTVPAGGSCWDAAQALHCEIAELTNCSGDRGCARLWAGDQLACGSCAGGEGDPSDSEPRESSRTYEVPSGGSCWEASQQLGCATSRLVNCTASRDCASLWRGDELACSPSDC